MQLKIKSKISVVVKTSYYTALLWAFISSLPDHPPPPPRHRGLNCSSCLWCPLPRTHCPQNQPETCWGRPVPTFHARVSQTAREPFYHQTQADPIRNGQRSAWQKVRVLLKRWFRSEDLGWSCLLFQGGLIFLIFAFCPLLRTVGSMFQRVFPAAIKEESRVNEYLNTKKVLIKEVLHSFSSNAAERHATSLLTEVEQASHCRVLEICAHTVQYIGSYFGIHVDSYCFYANQTELLIGRNWQQQLKRAQSIRT